MIPQSIDALQEAIYHDEYDEIITRAVRLLPIEDVCDLLPLAYANLHFLQTRLQILKIGFFTRAEFGQRCKTEGLGRRASLIALNRARRHFFLHSIHPREIPWYPGSIRWSMTHGKRL